jgi:CheY-like chemotaxis protein
MAKRLLLIDDEFNLSDPVGGYMWYYVQALRERGYEVATAKSFPEALDELAKHSFDMILLDVLFKKGKSNHQSPEGVVFADHLADSYPQIPVVILTSTNHSSTFRDLRNKANVKLVLQKADCTPSEAAGAISKLLEG